jgi:uncharacterized protein YjbI with pentapeptide repeats
MAAPVPPAPPELPDLHRRRLPAEPDAGELVLTEALVEDGAEAVAARSVRVEESALHGVTIQAGTLTELVLRDARLTGCDLSNVAVRHGEVRRAELTNCRLVGFAMGDGAIEDLSVTGGTLMLASLAQTTLRRVAFKDVNLREASFAHARLISVSFEDCDLRGADFRGVSLVDCTMRGTSLDAIAGVQSLRGLTMPWTDLVGSVGALAAALGIAVEAE